MFGEWWVITWSLTYICIEKPPSYQPPSLKSHLLNKLMIFIHNMHEKQYRNISYHLFKLVQSYLTFCEGRLITCSLYYIHMHRETTQLSPPPPL